MTTPTVDAIYNAAVDYATIKGYRLGNGADNDFRGAATRAANDVDAGIRTMAEAEAAFRSMIGEMIRQAQTIPGYAQQHPGVIGEQTLGAALIRLRIWPFG